MEVAKNYKDIAYKVFLEPTLENFRELAKNNFGEQDYIDYKSEWPEKTKLAKLILSLANYGGGAIIFGVSQNKDNSFECTGLEKLKDKAMLNGEISKYIPSNLVYDLFDLNYDNSDYAKLQNKKFQILIVDSDSRNLPYISKSEGKNIEINTVYTRDQTECVKVNNEQFQKIIDRRVKTYHISEKIGIEEHIKQLKILYQSLEIKKSNNLLTSSIFSLYAALTTSTIEKSEFYPLESFEEFIANCIDKKKKRIEIEMDIDF